jgi:hypothetical protein
MLEIRLGINSELKKSALTGVNILNFVKYSHYNRGHKTSDIL